MVPRVYTQLREGWISHHVSLLVVEAAAENMYRILGDENLTTGIGGYDSWKNTTRPFQPREQFLLQIREAIARKLKQRENQLKRAMLDPGKFCLVWEQIPGPGAFEIRQEQCWKMPGEPPAAGWFAPSALPTTPAETRLLPPTFCARKSGKRESILWYISHSVTEIGIRLRACFFNWRRWISTTF